MKYEFPDKFDWEQPKDAVLYFKYYLEEKHGQELSLSGSEFGRYCSVVSRNESEYEGNNFYEDLKYLMWGVFNTKDDVRSIAYCFYFWDKLNEYKEIKKEYDNQNKEVKESENYEKIEVEEEDDKEVLQEFM